MTAPSTIPTHAGISPASAPLAQTSRVPNPAGAATPYALPADSLLAILAGMALLEQGYSGEQTAAYVALGMAGRTELIKE